MTILKKNFGYMVKNNGEKQPTYFIRDNEKTSSKWSVIYETQSPDVKAEPR